MSKQVKDLSVGDAICVAEEIQFPLSDTVLHRPVIITVKSCVRMRDNSGDYAVAAEDANGRQWAERVPGDQYVNEPDDEIVARLQQSFADGVEFIKKELADRRNENIGKAFFDELLKELNHDHS